MKEKRKELIRTRFGSYNYNLMHEKSDEDFCIYVLPTKEDLFFNNTYVKETSVDDVDYKIHDIRRLSHLLFKSNLNFIEGLFSDDILILEKYRLDDDIDDELFLLIKELFLLRGDIAKMNLRYLYNACIGMSYKNKLELEKALDNYDIEKARSRFLSSFRILDFLIRYQATGFNNIKKAMRYTDEERKYMLSLKNNTPLHHVPNWLNVKRMDVEKIKKSYINQDLDEETFDKLNDILMKIVFFDLD